MIINLPKIFNLAFRINNELMVPQEVIERLTNKISKSVDRVINNLKRFEIETEPNITDRLLANLERDFEQDDELANVKRNIVLRTRTLKDKGPKAAERIYGADLATLLDIDVDNYKLQIGFLTQSKWESNANVLGKASVDTIYLNGKHVYPNPAALDHPQVNVETSGVIIFHMSRSDYDRMFRQCTDMLEITSDSFIFIYTANDDYVIPATAVIAGQGYRKQQQYYCKNFKLFMTDYLKSFIGDITLNGISDEDFQTITDKKQAKDVLLFQVSDWLRSFIKAINSELFNANYYT
jgi:hypothetical protein